MNLLRIILKVKLFKNLKYFWLRMNWTGNKVWKYKYVLAFILFL